MPLPEGWIDDLFEHYARMARIEGAKHYAWDRVNQLAREYPDLFFDFPQKLIERTKKKNENLSDGRVGPHEETP